MSDRTPQDQAVRHRVETDLDTTFAVEASAGTGKTALLTARLVQAIRTGRAGLDEIVAITFTERAANELKVRLRDRLELLLVDVEGAEADRLAAALASLDTAQVSTIHSFAAELLREQPIEAGIDPGFEVADQLRQSFLFDQVWTAWLGDELDDPGGPLRPAFLAGLRADQLKDFARFLLRNPDVGPAGADPDPDKIADQFVMAVVPRLRSAAQRMMEPGCPAECTCARRTLPAAEAVDRVEERDRDEQLGVLLTLEFEPSTRPRHACKDKEQKQRCIDEMKAIGAGLDEVRPAAGQWLVRHLADTLGRMLDRYAEAKRDRALLDFQDLLVKARDLLRDHKDVRRRFQGRFRMILVDECQDTDPLQTEIVLFLAEDGATADTWRDVRPAPGKLLFVGDPKQSIYRFRRADIEIYEEAKALVERSGEPATIFQNFRSTPACIGWVNAVFGELIERPEDGHYQPAYVPLRAYREDPGRPVDVLVPPEDAEFESIDAARGAEARAVAAHLEAMVERGDRVIDKETGRPRPVTYDDVALLFRRRTAFPMCERALEAAGIPYRAVSGRGFFARQEVAELRNVLAAIERPYDPLAVVAAMRTSLLGVSDPELAAAADGGFNYLDRVDRTDDSHVLRVFRLLADAHADRNTTSCSALVGRLLSQTKALELYYLKPGGEQRAANLTKLIDVARAYEEQPGATFGGFIRWLGDLSTAGEEEESPLANDQGEFVKMITIHKAKGLEFPVVVLCDIGADWSGTIEQVVDRRAGAYHIRVGSGAVQTTGFDDALEHEKRREEAERRRLFYVAATRARDRLVVPQFPKKGKADGYLGYLSQIDAETETRGEFESVVTAEPDVLRAAPPRSFRVDLSRRDGEACAVLCERRAEWEDARDELIERAREGERLRTASRLPGDEWEDFGPAAGGERAARAIGRAVHSVLELVDLKTGEGLGRLARAASTQNGIPDRCDDVAELARRALEMESVRRAAEADRAWREVPFAVCVDDTVLEGLIDLAFEEADGLHLVDYKTDDVAEDELDAHADRYRLQLGAYALAAREVFGRPPASASLLFLRPGREIVVPVDETLLDAVKGEL
ncbi:MAG: UvrD-helicase domain-containing protein [Planctomycetota bacterium]